MHTTNYSDAFISVADDCPATKAEIPPLKEPPTVAGLQFSLLHGKPYSMTSDELLFAVHAIRNDIPESEWESAQKAFFSKGQACLRSSPLAKRYGWGVHHDKEGKVALYAIESDEYQRLSADPKLKQVKAMRSKRA